jgi:hypothetical protein
MLSDIDKKILGCYTVQTSCVVGTVMVGTCLQTEKPSSLQFS